MEFHFNSPCFQPAGEQHTLLLEGVTQNETTVKGKQKGLRFDPIPAPSNTFIQDMNFGWFSSSVLTT